MANVPGTSGPVDYPNRPEGSDGNMGGQPPQSGSVGVRGPEEAPNPSPNAQQGAGEGSGGLYPNPGEPASGTIQKGYKGDSYASGGKDDFQPPDGDGAGGTFATGGSNAASVSALNVPTSFTKASTNQG